MYLGIDLGGTKIEALVLNSANEEQFRKRIPSPRDNYQETIKALLALYQEAEKICGYIQTIGLGIPGSLSPKNGAVRNANSTWLIGEDLSADLSKAFSQNLHIANDADCFTLSEAHDGAAAGKSCVMGLILGTGVGGGFCIDGKLLSGPNRISGEWGHNPIYGLDPNLPQRRCYCGRVNCVETYLSGPGLALSYQTLKSDNTLSAEKVVEDMRNGDAGAKQVFEQYISILARALANHINAVDPDAIVIGGGLSNIDELYDALPSAIETHVFSDTFATPILKAKHGDASGVRGAAWLGLAAEQSAK